MKNRGFTFIEAMITVVIIAILAAVSVPIITSYLDKAERKEVVSALITAKAAMERYKLDRGVYYSGSDLQSALKDYDFDMDDRGAFGRILLTLEDVDADKQEFTLKGTIVQGQSFTCYIDESISKPSLNNDGTGECKP